jgi:hypothetical protein
MDRFFDNDSFFRDEDAFEDYVELHYDDIYEDLTADGFNHDEAHTLAMEILDDMFRTRDYL